jgi:hypothetical protein
LVADDDVETTQPRNAPLSRRPQNIGKRRLHSLSERDKADAGGLQVRLDALGGELVDGDLRLVEEDEFNSP